MKLINDNTTQHIVFFPYRRWATYYFVCFLVHVIVLAEKFYVVTFLNKCNKTWESLDERSRSQFRTVNKDLKQQQTTAILLSFSLMLPDVKYFFKRKQ